jgi:hypothetical protein
MDHLQPPARTLLGSLLSSFSRSRRLEDRIRKLCAQAKTTTDPDELSIILDQLRTALHDHVERLRSQAAMRSLPPERRHPRLRTNL